MQILLGYALIATIVLLYLIAARTTAVDQTTPVVSLMQTSSQPSSSHAHTATQPRPDDDPEPETGGTSQIGGPTDKDDETFDQRIFPLPSHMPWSSAPLKPDADAPTTDGTCLTGQKAQEWYGPVSYTVTPYIPAHHRSIELPRFVQLTDIHLEPAYDAQRQSKDPKQLKVCRREDWADGEEADWNRTESKSAAHAIFAFGRSGCDAPLALLDSALDVLVSLAGPTRETKEDRKSARRQEDQERAAQELGGLVPPSTVVKGASAALPPYDFALLTGDLVAHFVASPSLHQATHDEVLSRITSRLSSRIVGGSANILPAIGNVDVWPTGYIEESDEKVDFEVEKEAASSDRKHASQSSKSSASTTTILCHPTFARLLRSYNDHGLLLTREAQESFCKGGYYSKRMDALGVRVIVLNTLPYSPAFISDPHLLDDIESYSGKKGESVLDMIVDSYPPLSCTSSSRSSDPFSQFSWLSSELRAAAENNERVLLAGHVPPGMKDGGVAWCEKYIDALRDVLKEAQQASKDLILAGVFGDFSEDVIRTLYAKPSSAAELTESTKFDPYNSARHPSAATGASAAASSALATMFVAPGLSPRKNANPSVRVWYLSRTTPLKEEGKEHDASSAKSATSNHTSSSSSKHKKREGKSASSQSLASASSSSKSSSNSPSVSLHDYTQFYLPLPYANGASLAAQPFSWQYQYSFRSAYQQADMSRDTLAGFGAALASNPLLMFQYQLHQTANNPAGPTYSESACDALYVDADENAACKRGEEKERDE